MAAVSPLPSLPLEPQVQLPGACRAEGPENQIQRSESLRAGQGRFICRDRAGLCSQDPPGRRSLVGFGPSALSNPYGAWQVTKILTVAQVRAGGFLAALELARTDKNSAHQTRLTCRPGLQFILDWGATSAR